jgi:c-di-GMP-binding flagellar brake protein YcgR
MGIFDKLFKATGAKKPERRPRVGARVPMEERAEMHRLKDGTAQSVILADLSYGGARIATPLKLAKNEELTLIVNAGRHKPFEVGCKVVAVRPRVGRLHFDYGVKFVAIKPGEVERLRKFVGERDDARKAGVMAFSKNSPR